MASRKVPGGYLIKLDLKTDGHVHTTLCRHASGSMEEYVKAAIQRGLERLFFLEHLEVGINYFERTWLNPGDFDRYFAEGNRLREKYGDKLFIGLGVETGYNPERHREILEKLAEYPWDRIAVSYHFMRIGDRHYNLVSRKPYNLEVLGRAGVAKVVSAYFDTLLEAVRTVPAQVVCHLDAVLRYHPQIRLERGHYLRIEMILAAMVERGMALEVNVSGCRMRGAPFPALDIIEAAVRRDIPLAVGSDAHRPEDVGQFGMLAEVFGESSVKLDG
ncbi:MAG: histidinol-phosphatase [Desulfurivibrionaceae bacterium]|nr:histidinol-phosphatase [Desulfobulbales bacterium]MDT8334252.1 histidinol-phosphatase [Desulfurivibrionaceae bacterium]